jgi:hypothetical protein
MTRTSRTASKLIKKRRVFATEESRRETRIGPDSGDLALALQRQELTMVVGNVHDNDWPTNKN